MYITSREVRAVAQECRSCNSGPYFPRLNEVVRGNELIVEASWICGRCGCHFDEGIVERRSLKDEEPAK